MDGAPKFKTGHVTSPRRFQGSFVVHRLRAMVNLSLYTKREVSIFTSPFDRAHMTSYSTLIETVRLSCTVYSYSAFSVESGQF